MSKKTKVRKSTDAAREAAKAGRVQEALAHLADAVDAQAEKKK